VEKNKKKKKEIIAKFWWGSQLTRAGKENEWEE
jgi:hypothetical protein